MKVYSFKIFLTIFILGYSYIALGGFDKVDRDLSTYDQQIKMMRDEFEKKPANPHDVEWVKLKLAHMFKIDQYMRKYTDISYNNNYNEEEKKYFNEKFMVRWSDLDRRNTKEIKSLLEIHKWFKISIFGKKSDNEAWILVQHADLDIEFQKRVLKILEKLYPINETSKSNYAYLYDRVAIGEDRQQVYGTQGKCVGLGKWEPHAIEEPVNVDRRRKKMGLVSMAEYRSYFKDICKKSD